MTRQSLLQTLAALLLLTACGSPGERATGGEGCPPEEMCSSKTPNGLWFSGAWFFDGSIDSGPKTTAVFGSQTITVLASSDLTDTFSEVFTTESTQPLFIDVTSPPTVIVSADGEGSGYLRIIDSETNELFDRISINSANVFSVRAAPVEAVKYDPEAVEKMNWALLSGVSLDLGFMLLDSVNNRLVDEKMTVDIAGDASLASGPFSWDTQPIKATGVGFADINVHTGNGDSFPQGMPIVDTIDDVVLVPSTLGSSTSLSIVTGKDQIYCFRGLSGNLAVAGLSWSVSTQGSISAKLEEASCFRVKAGATGSATLVASAAGFKKSFPITIKANAVAPAPASIVAPAPKASTGPRPGERGQ